MFFPFISEECWNRSLGLFGVFFVGGGGVVHAVLYIMAFEKGTLVKFEFFNLSSHIFQFANISVG